jgi:hypothetical protein
MSQHTRYLIRLLAIVLIVYGGVELVLGMKPVWWTLRGFFYPSQNTLLEILYFSGMIFFFNLMLPVAAIFGGTGLLQQKKWGWILSLTVSLVIFAFGFATTINYAIASYVLRNVPMPPIPEGAVVGEYCSMVPTYITTLVSIVFVFLLNRKSVKQTLKH